MKRTTINLGDVFEISTPRGLAYLQYFYADSEMGSLVRVLPGVHAERPASIETIVNEQEVFFTFFPVTAAVRRKILRPVGTFAIPASVPRPPVLRSPGRIDPQAKKIETWWLWDGTQSWCVNELDDEQKKLSTKAIWNDTLLIQRIVNGWRPTDYT